MLKANATGRGDVGKVEGWRGLRFPCAHLCRKREWSPIAKHQEADTEATEKRRDRSHEWLAAPSRRRPDHGCKFNPIVEQPVPGADPSVPDTPSFPVLRLPFGNRDDRPATTDSEHNRYRG